MASDPSDRRLHRGLHNALGYQLRQVSKHIRELQKQALASSADGAKEAAKAAARIRSTETETHEKVRPHGRRTDR